MQVWEIMNNKPIYVSVRASFQEVWLLIFKKHVNALPVVDNKKTLIGIITIEDILSKLYPSYGDSLKEFLNEANFEELEDKIGEIKDTTAQDIMNKEVYTAFSDDAILKAFSKMILKRVRQLPVIDYNDKLLGMVSKKDIFKRLFLPHFAASKK